MLTFFRRIRKGLLGTSQTRKYLLYAIGEIALVVIGILIALQLNNLNEHKITHRKQIKHLSIVKAEMINNLNSLKELDEKRLSIIEAERKIIGFIDFDDVNEKEFSEHLRTITFNELLVPFEYGALNELIASGGLKDIENDSIRSILASWEGKNTYLRSQETQLEDVRIELIKIYKAKGSLRTIVDIKRYKDALKFDAPIKLFSNKNLLKSKAFENAIMNHILLSLYLGSSIYPKIESDMLLVIKLIDDEIKKSKG